MRVVLQWGYGAGVDGIVFFMSERSSWASWRDKWWSVAVGRRARLRGCSRRTVASPAAAGRACGSGGVRGVQGVVADATGAERGRGETKNVGSGGVLRVHARRVWAHYGVLLRRGRDAFWSGR